MAFYKNLLRVKSHPHLYSANRQNKKVKSPWIKSKGVVIQLSSKKYAMHLYLSPIAFMIQFINSK